MTDEPPAPPDPRRAPASATVAQLSAREQRLAAALRENLRRRKAQSRERATPPSPPPKEG
ncbi:hypothetical protein [Muricoccus vinaceus]|uniref:Uncharacterized protein n=1 Tax=Muricoccus vinaceus TaxID=424704 RepID=A0ABV6INB8_9PROT